MLALSSVPRYFLLASLLLSLLRSNFLSEAMSDTYLSEREKILKTEKTAFFGGNLKLTEKEAIANEIILRAKSEELSSGHENVTEFLPAKHFFLAKNEIEKSKVFEIIKKVPKGGSLHTHLLAGVSVDFIIENFTRRANVYGCDWNGTFKLKFLQDPTQDTKCQWKSLTDYRAQNPNFDTWLRSQLSLVVPDPETYTTPESIWTPFKKIFTTEYDLVCYKPVFKEYIYQLLEELYQDNVTYTELKSTFMPLYELNGTVYTNEDFCRIFIETVEEFKRSHVGFIGAKFILSVYRGVSVEDLRTALSELISLQKLFPDFIAGFDFVGYEEEGRTLKDFYEVLLEVSKDLKFYFHAGETNWFGHTDLNMIDAILLGTSRIGHGFALAKHPLLANMTKEREIALELCPISNQVLLLLKDPRNHPLVTLLAQGFPVVVGNDDPSVWEAKGLSFDWYIVFMAMTPEGAGIEVLKQLAMNSIVYSAMSNEEKVEALDRWKVQWEVFVDEILATNRRGHIQGIGL